MSQDDSQLYQTAMRLIEGYNKWTMDDIMAPRSPNCSQQVYPARMDRPKMDNDTYRTFFSGMIPRFEDFRMEVLDVFEDRERHKVVLHARSTAKSAIGPYANEYSLMLTMTEDDKQVLEIKEFLDSGYTEDFFQRLSAHAASRT
ncbi:Core atranone cluster (CAC) protein 11 [Pseudocercospora fuligena]|uniref:Core atranone cluster (CAC) protein 11 n=1 Tax=Pseudocercospora fuligena TaxID=685502 RepID=A0A8H6VRN9_9PEZI|nr:Core atranone cluster (CAC) protein 11 [Pseudocercospora fuligena]